MEVRTVAPPPLRKLYREGRTELDLPRSPLSRPRQRFLRSNPPVVQAGPFAGMVYPKYALKRSEVIVARLVGAFELELHGVLSEMIAERPAHVVNIGSADGYYAVGLARALPESTVHAFEMLPELVKVAQALAQTNGTVDRTRFLGEATIPSLRALPVNGSALVISDCEGAEVPLLDPEQVPWMQHAQIIVELHDHLVPESTATILDRFGSTHEVELIDSQPRWPAEWPVLERSGLGFIDRNLALSEFREVPMRWAVLRPRLEL